MSSDRASRGSLLYVFARAPEPGRTKTRLAAHVGAEAAARLAVAFVEDVCAATRTVAERRVLSVSGDAEHVALRRLLEREEASGAAMEVARQGEGDLGERMHQAIVAGLERGADRVAIVGSDVPLIDAEHVRETFTALAGADVVLGPADDGGYWIVGARRAVPWLFAEMAWGTAGVFAESARRLDESALRWTRARPAWDVDEPADLERLNRALALDHGTAPSTRRALAELGLATARWSDR